MYVYRIRTCIRKQEPPQDWRGAYDIGGNFVLAVVCLLSQCCIYSGDPMTTRHTHLLGLFQQNAGGRSEISLRPQDSSDLPGLYGYMPSTLDRTRVMFPRSPVPSIRSHPRQEVDIEGFMKRHGHRERDRLRRLYDHAVRKPHRFATAGFHTEEPTSMHENPNRMNPTHQGIDSGNAVYVHITLEQKE